MHNVTNICPWIVIMGNPIDGFMFFGPFKTYDDALIWAGKQPDEVWWVEQLSDISNGIM